MRKLSIVIPVYNEAATIRKIVGTVKAVDLGDIEKELILVDDCSSDGTRQVLQAMQGEDQALKVLFHEVNQGKGAALRTGFASVKARRK